MRPLVSAALVGTVAAFEGSGTTAALQVGEASAAVRHTPICIDGKAVTDFYLLGVAKSATTTLATTLFDCGMSATVNYYNGHIEKVKEPYVFEHICRDMGSPKCTDIDDLDEARERFASIADVDCGDAQGTLSDMSPGNVQLYGMPHLLRGVYGSAVRKLSFVVLLREPLARWQSQFHYAQQNGKGGKEGVDEFADDIAFTEGRLSAYGSYDELVGNFSSLPIGQIDGWARSMYGMNLRPWLEEPAFHSSQFAILPMQYMASHTRETIQHLVTRFHWVGVDPALAPVRGDERNEGQSHHASPDSEVTEETRRRLLINYFAPDAEALANLLSRHMPEGLIVAGFNGSSAHPLERLSPRRRAKMLLHHLRKWW